MLYNIFFEHKFGLSHTLLLYKANKHTRVAVFFSSPFKHHKHKFKTISGRLMKSVGG